MGSVHDFFYKPLILLLSDYLIPLFLYFIRLFRRNLEFREKEFGDLRVFLEERFEKIELDRRLGEGDDEEIVEFSFKFRNFEDGFEEKDDSHEEIIEDLNEKVDQKVDEEEFNQESVYSYVNSHTDSFTLKNIHLSIGNPIDPYDDEFEADFEEKEAPHEEIFEDSNEKVDQKVDEEEFNQESVYSYVNSHTDSFTSKDIHLSIGNPVGAYDDYDDEFKDDFEEKKAPHDDLSEKVDQKVDEQKFNQESVYSYVNSPTDSVTSKNIHLPISNSVDVYGGGDDDDDDFEEKEAPHEDSDEKVDQKVDEHKFNQESVYSYVNLPTDSFTSKNIHLSINTPVDAYEYDGGGDDDFEEKETPHEEILENSTKKVDHKVDTQKFHKESVYSYVNKDSNKVDTHKFHKESGYSYVNKDSNKVDTQKFHQESVYSYVNKDSNKVDTHKFHQESVYSYVNKDSDSITSNNFHSSNSVDLKESEEKTAKNRSNDSRNKLESLMEHQELIEQLEMEIKKVKVNGLPTIFEESESPPKIMEFQPWKKIEESYSCQKNVVGHNLNEVHKFYKIYKERMRKFDIFSYQKMYATGFLKLNDPFQSISSSRSLVPEITTHLCRRFSSPKVKKHERNPTRKFIKELQNDLEVVYVGQMCLSWEILRWQYEKVLEIWESDPRGVHQFYEVSGEFQRFLVLMQRFLEEEPFHGPRVQNYTKTRCVFQNLLQVPLVREDGPKNKRKARIQVDENDMSCEMLVEILEESIRLFWRFIRADKDTRKTPLEFQNPEDSRLFMEVQKDLHKKERKLKEQLRSENCMLKRLRSWKEENSNDQVLWFFSQIDLKLVARVLQMSKLTPNQLFWCQNQLKKVRFFNRKIHVEPSFLLFPC